MFSSKEILKRHDLDHNIECKQLIKCHVCEHAYTHEKHLWNHLKD